MQKLLLGGWILFSLAGRAEERWMRLSTSHFEVFTNAGVGNGREVVRRFEQIREVLLNAGHMGTSAKQPVRIFVFRSESEFAGYRDPQRKSLAGLYQAGPDRDYIAMENTGTDLYRVVFHEYVHLVMSHSGASVPLWLNEGTAELFSTIETTGSQTSIGGTIPAHIETLRHGKILGLPALMSVGTKSPEYNEEKKAGVFYAESWALVHMLNLSPEYAPGLHRFLEMVLMGAPETEAFQTAYGQSIDEIFRRLLSCIQEGRFKEQPFQRKPLDAIGTIDSRQLSASESTIALADLLINLDKPQEAERKLKKVPRNHRNAWAIEEALGDASLAQRRNRDALEHYQRAIDSGSRSARVFFEIAALVRETQGDLRQAISDLQKAIEIDPSYAQARDLLARIEFTSKQAEDPVTHVERDLSPKVPKSWQNRTGDRRIDGKLVQVDCLGKAARLYVLLETQKIALHVDDPSKVVLTNAPGSAIEFACGAMQPRDVAVDYIAKWDPELKTAGEITAIQFK